MASVVNLIVMIAGIITLSVIFYEPIPKGFSNSSAATVRFVLASMKVIHSMSYVGELIGYDTSLNITRFLTYYILRRANEKPLIGMQTRDTVFDGVHVRIYEPVKNNEMKRRGFVFFHGGGWCLNGIGMFMLLTDSYQAFVAKMSNETDAVFVSVEFRLAPEYPYPAGFDDCVKVTKHFLSHASNYRVDPERIAIGGDSSGGNLAAAVAIRLRDESFTPALKLQVLLYPSLQLADFSLPSMLTNSEGALLTRKRSAEYRAMYVCGNISKAEAFVTNSHISDVLQKKLTETFLNVSRLPSKYLIGYKRVKVTRDRPLLSNKERNEIRDRILSPYVSPLLAGDLKGLPRVLLLTCDADVLRDEGFLYASRLKEAGVSVKHVNTELGFHGFLTFSNAVPEANEVLINISRYVVANL